MSQASCSRASSLLAIGRNRRVSRLGPRGRLRRLGPTGFRLLLVLSLLAPAALIPATAHAQGGTRHAAVHFGLGTLSAVSTLVYGSAKFVYAVLGSATGGLAYVITGFDGEVARRIIQPAVRGDYVVTPENLTAEEPLVFVGRDPYRP